MRRSRKAGEKEPLAAWKEARRAALRDSRPVRMLLAAASLAAVAFALRRRPAWAAAAAGAGLVFVLADLTCYYASILLLLGLLVARAGGGGVVTSLLAAATCTSPFLFRWEDDRSALVSALILGAFVLLLALLAREKKPTDSLTPRRSKTKRSTGAQPWDLTSSPRQIAHCGRLPV